MQFAKAVLFSCTLVVRVLKSALNAQQSAPAQSGPCTEQFVKEQFSKNRHDTAADDAYFFSGALEKPVIGRAAKDQAFKPVAAQRTNAQYRPLKPDRIVAILRETWPTNTEQAARASMKSAAENTLPSPPPTCAYGDRSMAHANKQHLWLSQKETSDGASD